MHFCFLENDFTLVKWYFTGHLQRTLLLRKKDTLLPRGGREMAMLFFDFLIGDWITKIACTLCGLIMFHVLKHWSLKMRVFLIIVVINQVNIYIAQPISLDWAERDCAWKEPPLHGVLGQNTNKSGFSWLPNKYENLFHVHSDQRMYVVLELNF